MLAVALQVVLGLQGLDRSQRAIHRGQQALGVLPQLLQALAAGGASCQEVLSSRAAATRESLVSLAAFVEEATHEGRARLAEVADGQRLLRTLRRVRQDIDMLRRAAREADDWITVDSLAHPYATGVAAEPYRWAEIELLVYSPSRWERRLVGSTIATLTHGSRGRKLGPEIVARSLPILEQLMGDAEPDVQKALAWAYRSLAQVDREATTDALRQQTELAATTDDGHRAWVIRDALAKLDAADADAFRERLAGIRKRPGAPSTSPASQTAAAFGPLPDPRYLPEPPLA